MVKMWSSVLKVIKILGGSCMTRPRVSHSGGMFGRNMSSPRVRLHRLAHRVFCHVFGHFEPYQALSGTKDMLGDAFAISVLPSSKRQK